MIACGDCQELMAKAEVEEAREGARLASAQVRMEW